MIQLNKIYNENCIETMNRMSTNSIDMVITSPPYDNLRTYKNSCDWSFDIFKGIANKLFTVIKDGGVIAWVVGDAVIKGSETGTSFKQALYFKEIGFNLHDTMIYQKNNFSHPERIRYHSVFEYIFILSKGQPRVFNPIKDRKNITAGLAGSLGINTYTTQDGSKLVRDKKINSEFGMRHNVWKGKTRGQEEMCVSLKHPAMMPKWLVNDLMISWSNQNDVIYDPFVGSGTVLEIAVINKRNYIGSEIISEYCALSEENIKKIKA